jgi:hypothetical protein
MLRILSLIALCLTAGSVAAQTPLTGGPSARVIKADPAYVLPKDEDTAAFVQSNLIFVFYHEAAHALIDVMMLPVLGREEDAADTLSVLLIDTLWEEDSAQSILYDAALAFLLYSEEADQSGAGLAFWGQHALDRQRYYNLICLFYGADPETRAGLAEDLGLPAPRRESCPEEYELAADSWAAMLEGMPPQDSGPGFRLRVPADRDPYTKLIAEEIETLNGEYGLPRWIDVTVDRCGEPNAFYDPRARRVVMCIEYAEDMARLFSTQQAQ